MLVRSRAESGRGRRSWLALPETTVLVQRSRQGIRRAGAKGFRAALDFASPPPRLRATAVGLARARKEPVVTTRRMGWARVHLWLAGNGGSGIGKSPHLLVPLARPIDRHVARRSAPVEPIGAGWSPRSSGGPGNPRALGDPHPYRSARHTDIRSTDQATGPPEERGPPGPGHRPRKAATGTAEAAA